MIELRTLATNFGSHAHMVTKVGGQFLATKFGFVPDWSLQRMLLQVVLADAVVEHAPRLPQPVVFQVWQVRRLRWHGHDSYGRLKKVQKLNPTGGRGRGHPKKTWAEVFDMDRLALGLTETHPSDRNAWSGRLRSAVRPPLY